MQNVEQVRFNMVEQQIRPWDVSAPTVLELLKHVRRDHFVPEGMKEFAYMDMEIPLGHGASMWAPRLEAHALQALCLGRDDRVLEIGSGSGYLTALLATLAGHVTSVEIEPELSAMAARNLGKRDNVTLEIGDGARGWGNGATYDAIVLTGSTPVLPDNFRNSLNIGGRLFAIVGDAPVMEAKLITRISDDTFETVEILETCVAPLKNAQKPSRFIF